MGDGRNTVECPHCQGHGMVPDGTTMRRVRCPTCGGMGWVEFASLVRQGWPLEAIAGLLPDQNTRLLAASALLEDSGD